MSTEGYVEKWQILAGEDLTGGLFKFVTASGKFAQSGATTYPDLPLGVLRSNGKTGESVALATEGISKVFFGAAVNTLGWPVICANSGFAVPTSMVSVQSQGTIYAGRALAIAASGDLAPILLTP